LIIALYPGSFDPITNGHIDIAARASKLFDKIVIGIFATPEKRLTFSLDERVDLARKSVAHLPNIEVQPYSTITVDFAREMKEVASLGGNINGLVPKHVAEALRKKGVSRM
jgi:pantetheine-phosphate adenylyltransferase